MYDIKPELYDLLVTIPGITVKQGWPEKKPSSFPLITFYELQNSASASTLEGERESRIAIQIDVWAKTSAERDSVAKEVNTKMASWNFSREMAHDLAEKIGKQAIRRKTMRFAAYLDLKTLTLYRNPMKR